MPKDIRSYFSTSLKTTKKQLPSNKPAKDIPKPNRKRKKNIVLSDSDDDGPQISPNKTRKKNAETSNYFEMDQNDVHKVFGKSPVKRKSAPSKNNKVLNDDGKKNGKIDEHQKYLDDDVEIIKDFTNENEFLILNEQECISTSDEASVAKKRKLHCEGPKIKENVTLEKALDEKLMQNITKENSKKEEKRITPSSPQKNFSPRKSGSPRKRGSPQKSSSPQKTLSSYFEKTQNSPTSRFNKLEIKKINKSADISPKKAIEEKDKKLSPKSFKKITEVVEKKEVGGSMKQTIATSFHDISPDVSDDEMEIMNNKVSSSKSNPAISVKRKLEESFCSHGAVKEVNSAKPIKKNLIKSAENKPDKIKFTSVSNQPKFNLWVDKYRPVNLKNIIGQQGEKSIVNKLVYWLKNWFENHNGHKKLTRPSPWAKNDNGAYFKAALLSGPPGIGKTTTAHLVCKELGMDIVEFNASDTRSKKLLNLEISELLTSKSLSPFMQGGTTSRQHVLVMDEVDGMAGNEDRGGIQELIMLIKNSKIPIICMCNDRNHPKIRSLVNYCFDLRFNRPRVEQIKGAMMSVCFKENLKIKPDMLIEIISSTNQDIRLILNHLSMLSANREQNMNITNKEIKMGAWDVIRKVFSNTEHKNMSIHDKCDLFFHDYSIAPLFVQENYLNVIPYPEKGMSKKVKMSLFSKAANSLCYGDLVEQAIRTQNAWSLLPTQAVFSSLIPGETLSGRVGGIINFPTWLGKNSKKNKMDRLSQEIQMHTRLKASASKEAICTDYSYKLRDGIALPLVNFGIEGVSSSLQFLHDYYLLREDVESLTELTTWSNTEDPFSSLDSKVKASFTRAYNKHPVLSPFSISTATAVKKGGRGNAEENFTDLINNEENNEEIVVKDENDSEEEKDDLSSDGMIIMKKKEKTDKTKKERTKTEESTNKKPRGEKRRKK